MIIFHGAAINRTSLDKQLWQIGDNAQDVSSQTDQLDITLKFLQYNLPSTSTVFISHKKKKKKLALYLAKIFVFFFFSPLGKFTPLTPSYQNSCNSLMFPNEISNVQISRTIKLLKKKKEQKITHPPKRNPQINTRYHSPSSMLTRAENFILWSTRYWLFSKVELVVKE